MSNLSAGIGDPYWYEWLVGVNYVLDMLPPDTDIEYVTLQASHFQGLDDIVIGFKNGKIDGIQVKHTREENSLTFNNLIYAPENKQSLLAELYSDWDALRENSHCTNCQAILLTNRKSGNRQSTVTRKNQKPIALPPLKEFWPKIKEQIDKEDCCELEKIKVETEWHAAWQLFLDELKNTDNKTKLEFLKNFSIKADEEDLEGYIQQIRKKLASYFKTDEHTLIQMDKSLCYSIRKWATTLRNDEKITREDLFEALSLAQDNLAGDHNLSVCHPFFSSREEFVKNVEEALKNRVRPIIFLSGIPGSGKTNIVSYIANKSFSTIDLRFHAFKPLLPGDKYLPNDHGLSDPCALWGDLLIQLRAQLKGRLAEFNVPISNQILRDYARMREEVLRIADEYGKKENKTVVIAIDGIDHAARAGADNNFLRTLVPPDGVPDNVCFLISGQPLEYYDLYPDWLHDTDAVLHYDVPNITTNDVVQLLQQHHISLTDCSSERTAEIIIEKIAGNTLSAVFAVYECKNISTIEELIERLECSALSSGIQSYYEYIWKESKKSIPPQVWYIDTQIATMLSVYTARITAEEMALIFPELQLPPVAWDRIFASLYPIVIRESGGYRVLHNDVRVYLQRHIRGNAHEYQGCCLKIANFLFSQNGNPILRHELGFKLLAEANRQDLYITYFTSEYVLNAIYLKRPLQEIEDQLEKTIPFFSYQLDFTQQLTFECAVETLSQYQMSMQEQEMCHISFTELPSVLPCEKKVLSRTFFSSNELRDMFDQISWLIDEGEISRAHAAMVRWLGDITPFDLVELLARNEGQQGKPMFLYEEHIHSLLTQWGTISYQLNLPIFQRQGTAENNYIAYWSKGWLLGAQQDDPASFLDMWHNCELLAFTSDVESMLIFLLKEASVSEVLSFVDRIDVSQFSYNTKVYWVCWAILHNLCEKCSSELEEILANSLILLNKREESYTDNPTFVCGTIIAFILRLYNSFLYENFDTFVATLLEKTKGFKVSTSDRGYFIGNNLVLSGILLADIFSDLSCEKRDFHWNDNLKLIIESVFDERDGVGCVEIGGTLAKRFVLSLLIYVSESFPDCFEDAVINMVTQHALKTETLTTINIWWPYLKCHSKERELFDIFQKWFAPNTGIVWSKELGETHNIADIIMPLASEMGWDSEIEAATRLLNYSKVGYISRKDYSLYKPLDWFVSISKDALTWQSPGVDFLNISDYASCMGDNRAAVRIDGSVAAVVGYKGIIAIDAFIRTIEPTTLDEFELVLDAIIECFAYHSFSNADILEIWKTVVVLLHIDHSLPEYDSDNSIRIIYLIHLRTAIKEYLNRHSENDGISLMKEMLEFSPFEYEVNSGPEAIMFDLPDRWFYSHQSNSRAKTFAEEHSSMSVDMAFISLQELIEKEGSSRWDAAIGFLDVFGDDTAADSYIDAIFALSMQFRGAESWEYDGICRLYERLWLHLDANQKKQLTDSLLGHYNRLKRWRRKGDLSNLYSFSDDIHRMILWQLPTLNDCQKVEAVNELLFMHTNWITALHKKPFSPKYAIIAEEHDTPTWQVVCNALKEFLLGKI